MKLKIAVIELDFHWDVLDAFCKMFSNTEHELTIFTQPFIYQHLKKIDYNVKIEWVLNEKGSKKEFLKSSEQKLNSFDAVFINTISSDFGAYAGLYLNTVTLLRVHNAFKLLSPWNHLKISPTPYYLWKAASYFIREIVRDGFWIHRKTVVEKPWYLTFPEKSIHQFILQEKLVSPSKLAPPLPTKVYEGFTLGSVKKDFFQITIAGSVDKRRRDYEFVVSAFKKLVPQLKSKVHLTLLGRASSAYGNSITAQLKELESSVFSVEYFEKTVPEENFNTVMKRSDLLLCPVTADGRSEIYGEIYGKTKISGSVNDIIKFPCPAFVPHTYTLSSDWSGLLEVYEDERDFNQKLLQYINNPDLLISKKQKIATFVEKEYNPATIRETLIKFIKEKNPSLDEKV